MAQSLHIAVVGLGGRGIEGTMRATYMVPDTEIVAVCDLNEDRLAKALTYAREHDRHVPKAYVDYHRMLEQSDIDAVLVSTSWLAHVPIACDCMRAGKYVAFEVGGAFSLDQCRKLVDTYEETGVPCMLLENNCYPRPAMAVFNMIKKGLFGDIVHAEGAYCHFFAERQVKGLHTGTYRIPHYLHRNCDNYPCHGIALPYMALNINRGNRFVSLVSVSTKSLGIRNATKSVFGENCPEKELDWQCGDVITSILKTAHGETVTLSLDTSLPRPKTDRWMVQGTKGIYMQDGEQIYLDGITPLKSGNREHPDWEPAEPWLRKYEHPLWKEKLALLENQSGHFGEDVLVIEAFLEAVRNHTNTPIDAYDAATYIAISALSEQSIAEGSRSVFFPDFTDGKWIARKPDYSSKYSLDGVYDDLF